MLTTGSYLEKHWQRFAYKLLELDRSAIPSSLHFSITSDDVHETCLHFTLSPDLDVDARRCHRRCQYRNKR